MKPRLSVLGTFLDTIERHSMFSSGERVLVAVSGGADSVCLLDLLVLARPRLGLALVGFHMNHLLRPEAERDEQFVRAMFVRLGLELVVVRSHVNAYARRHRLGLEQAGRDLRYRHMARVATQQRCTRIALGHTAGDSLETMILNLARGTGPNGLTGIPPRRERYVRPLIDLERDALVRHLESRGLEWVEDQTNAAPDFRRNLVRLRVVPVLKQVNQAAVGNARRTARLLEEENTLLDRLASDVVRRCISTGRWVVRIDTAKLREYNTVLKRRAVRRVLPGLDSAEVEKVLALCLSRPGARLTLGRGLHGRLRAGSVELRFSKEFPAHV
jgi:tRNA(Ile)-lysidine synthase